MHSFHLYAIHPPIIIQTESETIPLIILCIETINPYTRIAVDEASIKRAEEIHRKNNISSFFAVKQKKAEKELEKVKMIRQGLY